jgi:hypothetical protein
MADIYDCAVIATAGIAIDQKVTATVGPHVAQRHRCEFPNFEVNHAHHVALQLAFLQGDCVAHAFASSPVLSSEVKVTAAAGALPPRRSRRRSRVQPRQSVSWRGIDGPRLTYIHGEELAIPNCCLA